MKEVSEFEARLLRILRCLMHRMPVEQTLALLVKPIRRPRCLSRNCVELVQDGLSKGVTEWLARSGWPDRRFIQNEAIVEGRMWERHPIDKLQLSFSANSLKLLIWLTASNFVEPNSAAKINPKALTVGDRLLMLMVFAAIRSTPGGPTLLKQPGFSEHGLISLMFPADVGVVTRSSEPDVTFWCQPQHSWVLETLQSRLSQQWFRIECDKRGSSNDGDMRRIGEFQAHVLSLLFDTVEQQGRQDLCMFLLSAGQHLLQTIPTEKWFDRLDVRHLRMADRSEVYKSALAFFHGVKRLQKWTQHAQGIGFYDEDYQASQLWKSEWERLEGDCLVTAARSIIQRVAPVKAVGVVG